MPKIKNHLDKKVNAYIDNLFSGISPTQQLYDLKEELVTNIKEKLPITLPVEWTKSKPIKRQ